MLTNMFVVQKGQRIADGEIHALKVRGGRVNVCAVWCYQDCMAGDLNDGLGEGPAAPLESRVGNHEKGDLSPSNVSPIALE